MQTAAFIFLRTALFGSIISLAACSSLPFSGKDEAEVGKENMGSFKAQTTAIGVNGFLWRAALDTLSKLPLESTDSTGGVIVTDWFLSDKAPDERLKVSVYIMDDQLRADALRVVVHRQTQMGGQWSNAVVNASTAQRLEDTILLRAREMRISTID